MNRRFLSSALMFSAACGAFLLTSCETIDTRISQNASTFQSLSAQDQELVRHGQIRAGMPQSAVYLAWGNPDQKTMANVHGRPAETWVYTAESTVYPYPYHWGVGFGFYGGGRYYSRHGRRFYGFGYDPFYDPFFYPWNDHVSYPQRTVSFQNGRVVAFQFLAPPTYH